MLSRIHRLEEAVFKSPIHDNSSLLATSSRHKDVHLRDNVSLAYPPTSPALTGPQHGGTPFSHHELLMLRDQPTDPAGFVPKLLNRLPPWDEARLLFDHFFVALHPTFGVLHIPSTRSMMEETYRNASDGDTEVCVANILMLFSIFAGAALSWTPQFLRNLGAVQKDAKAAFKAYTHLAISILDHDRGEFPTSISALAAVTTLAFVVSNASFSLFDVHLLRCRCMLMAKVMQIDRLDTVKCREDRRLKGYNMVEIEVQRRIWWHLVASDW